MFVRRPSKTLLLLFHYGLIAENRYFIKFKKIKIGKNHLKFFL